MARSWIRLYTVVPYSPKIQRLPDHLFRFLINCWCITGESSGDFLPPLSELAWKLRVDEAICKAYIEHLISLDLLEVKRGETVPKNWMKHQYVSDTSTARVRKFRENKKLIDMKRDETVSVTAPDQNRPDTEQTKTDREVSVEMTPSLDEQFQEYRRLFEIVGNPIPEDFDNGSFCWRSWNVLDYHQRVTVIDSLKAREAAGVSVLHSAASYLQKIEYKRPIRRAQNGNGRMSTADRIDKAISEA